MQKPIGLALPAEKSATVEQHNHSNPCPIFSAQKQSCPSMKPEIKMFKSINFKDAKDQRLKTFPRTLHILFKKAAQSRQNPSWMVLRGKERRKNIKQIMQTLGCGKVINPYSAEQFQSFKNALEEHGQEEEVDEIHEDNSQIVDDQEVCFDFGGDYGDSEFLDLGRKLEYENLSMHLFRGMVSSFCKNRVSDDSRYIFNDLMQLSSVEETLNDFSKEKLF